MVLFFFTVVFFQRDDLHCMLCLRMKRIIKSRGVIMNETFEDIKIISKPDLLKVKAGSKPYTRIFPFPISSVPPQRWNELLIQEWTCRIMQNPRHIWVKGKDLIIDCHSEE